MGSIARVGVVGIMPAGGNILPSGGSYSLVGGRLPRQQIAEIHPIYPDSARGGQGPQCQGVNEVSFLNLLPGQSAMGLCPSIVGSIPGRRGSARQQVPHFAPISNSARYPHVPGISGILRETFSSNPLGYRCSTRAKRRISPTRRASPPMYQRLGEIWGVTVGLSPREDERTAALEETG